jgi:hypothetical protein
MNTITARVEAIANLTGTEVVIVTKASSNLNTSPVTLDWVEQFLGGLRIALNAETETSPWFVYRGGCHVALIKGTERILLAVENGPAIVAGLRTAVAGIVAANKGAVLAVKAHADDAPTVALVAQLGDIWDVYANQGLREGWVLAVIGNDVLVEYTMPKGTTALRIVKTSGLAGFQNVSYRNVPRKWLEAIVAAGSVWEGKAQGVYQPASRWGKSNDRRVATPSQMLAAKGKKADVCEHGYAQGCRACDPDGGR